MRCCSWDHDGDGDCARHPRQIEVTATVTYPDITLCPLCGEDHAPNGSVIARTHGIDVIMDCRIDGSYMFG